MNQKEAIQKYGRTIVKRVTARKHGGDDAYSWAIFVDGRVRLEGLSATEVAYYKAKEYARLADERRTDDAARSHCI